MCRTRKILKSKRRICHLRSRPQDKRRQMLAVMKREEKGGDYGWWWSTCAVGRPDWSAVSYDAVSVSVSVSLLSLSLLSPVCGGQAGPPVWAESRPSRPGGPQCHVGLPPAQTQHLHQHTLTLLTVNNSLVSQQQGVSFWKSQSQRGQLEKQSVVQELD